MSEHDEALRKRLEKMVLDHARLHGDGPYAPKSSAAWCDAVESVALDLLAKLDTVEAREPKWIPCSERMPDKDGEYLVWISNDTDNADGIYLELRIYQRYWEGFDESVVTHWMPLPAPPTEPTMTQDPEVG